jgi:hypothetical protein
MSSFYEPWTPRPGDRVEIHPSPECKVTGTGNSPQARIGVRRGHLPWETGKRGTVRQNEAAEAALLAQGHRFLVRWDEPVDVGGRPVFGASYAAAELIPAEPDEQDDEPAWPPPLIEGEPVELPGFDVPERPAEKGRTWTA